MKQLTTKMNFLQTTILLVTIPLFCFGSDKDEAVTKRLFKSSKPIELILQMDMEKVLNDRSEEPEYIPAFLVHRVNDEVIHTFNIKVKARGNTRRIQNICEFPPLKINFAKKSTKNTIFEGQDKIKMVTHCNESEQFQNYALLEYLAYKTYNSITNYSYQVRLVNITY